jgi:hypothetical protein
MARFVVDWQISGSWEVEAKDAQDAQEKFDKAWGRPKGVMPERDGEVSNDHPYLVESR